MANPPWTYSQLDTFESCPRKFYRTKVLRDIVEPPTIHTKWGTDVHTAFENAITYGEALPDTMSQWQTIANKIGKLPGDKLCEYKFSIDKAFEPVGWKDAWSRGIADLVVIKDTHAVVMDYKTGKRKLTEQLDLYAMYTYHHFPEVTKVTTGFVWLKEKKLDWNTTTREEIPVVWQKMLPRVAKLESAYERDKWPARTSGLCRGWCPVKDCEFYSEKR